MSNGVVRTVDRPAVSEIRSTGPVGSAAARRPFEPMSPVVACARAVGRTVCAPTRNDRADQRASGDANTPGIHRTTSSVLFAAPNGLHHVRLRRLDLWTTSGFGTTARRSPRTTFDHRLRCGRAHHVAMRVPEVSVRCTSSGLRSASITAPSRRGQRHALRVPRREHQRHDGMRGRLPVLVLLVVAACRRSAPARCLTTTRDMLGRSSPGRGWSRSHRRAYRVRRTLRRRSPR